MNGLQGSMNSLKYGCGFVGRYIFLDEGMMLIRFSAHAQVFSRVQLFCDPHGLQPAMLLCPWGFPGKNTVVISRGSS